MKALVAGRLDRLDIPQASDGASADRHARGMLTARERLDVLFDPGSFREAARDNGSARDSDGVVTGRGLVSGRPVFVFSKDIAVAGGSVSAAHAAAIAAMQAEALHVGAPLVCLFDGWGARLSAGSSALAGYGSLLRGHAEAAGRIPQIAVIMGPCIGCDAMQAGLCDFVFVVRESGTLYLTGPEIVRALSNEAASTADCGAAFHAEGSGIASAVCAHDFEALIQVRRLLDMLPLSSAAQAPDYPIIPAADDPALNRLVADTTGGARDVDVVIGRLVDEAAFVAIGSAYARNIVIGFGRLAGQVVGVVANQPLVLGGVLDAAAARKAARFVRFCDRFGIPIVTLIDAPGFLPGTDSERGGIVAHVADLLATYATATVPRLAVVTGCAFGGALLAMASKAIGCDRAYAWPNAAIGLNGIGDGHGPVEPGTISAASTRARDTVSVAGHEGLVDRVIRPSETRKVLAQDLSDLRDAVRRPR